MRKSRRPILIASRRSLLARRQAEMVGEMLGSLNPHVEVQHLWLDSEGDSREQAPATAAAPPIAPLGKGVFVRAIETALLSGRADIAVHSLKDLPTLTSTEGLITAAIPPRVDPRDCLISRSGAATIEQLPQGAQVGTASPRRAAQLRRRRPDLRVRPIRGNIETRLRKVMQDGEHEATLLAVAGLLRADLGQHAAHPIPPETLLPAPGQGALAVQCRANDHTTVRRCLPVNDSTTAIAVNAEREIVAALGCDCFAPIAAFAEPLSDHGADSFRLRVRLLSPDGSRSVEADERVTVRDLAKATKRVIKALRRQGAMDLVAEGAGAAGALRL